MIRVLCYTKLLLFILCVERKRRDFIENIIYDSVIKDCIIMYMCKYSKLKAAHTALILACEYLIMYYNIFEHIILCIIILKKKISKKKFPIFILRNTWTIFFDLFPGWKKKGAWDRYLAWKILSLAEWSKSLVYENRKT